METAHNRLGEGERSGDCMKTPQEEAKRIFNETYTSWFEADWPNRALPVYMDIHIPLAELIAVARAAASDKKDEECTCGTDPERYCRYCGYFSRLDKALQALRATGKVEL